MPLSWSMHSTCGYSDLINEWSGKKETVTLTHSYSPHSSLRALQTHMPSGISPIQLHHWQWAYDEMWVASCHWLLVLWISHYLQGSQTSSQPWYNLSRQDIQPLCHDAILTPDLEEAHNKRNDSGNIFFSARINRNIAYQGSCCLEIEGETQMLETLHDVEIKGPWKTQSVFA